MKVAAKNRVKKTVDWGWLDDKDIEWEHQEKRRNTGINQLVIETYHVTEDIFEAVLDRYWAIDH